MKTIYSFQEFYDAVMELAISKGKEYISIEVKKTTHNPIQFGCYVDGYSKYWYGATPDEAIAKLRDQLFPPSPDKTKVDIEIEAETE